MLIEWTVMAAAAVVAVLLADWAIQLSHGDGRGERIGGGSQSPGPVSAGPVVVGPRGTGKGGAAA
jgi:hypothetical protein